MRNVNAPPLYDKFLEFLVEKATPEEILAFKADEETQSIVQDLITRNSAGELSLEENQMLEEMLQFERMMSQLKIKALVALNNKPT